MKLISLSLSIYIYIYIYICIHIYIEREREGERDVKVCYRVGSRAAGTGLESRAGAKRPTVRS